MTRSRSIIVWLLAFSLGLNVMLVGMGLMGVSFPKPAAKPVPEGQKWTYTNLFPMDDPELKLTPEQKAKVADVRRRISEQELRLNTQTADRVNRWYGFLLTNTARTSETIDPYVVEMRYGTKDLMMRLVNSLNEHQAILTPEQNKILNARLAKKFKELASYSQKRLIDNRTRLKNQYGEDFVKSVTATVTTGTLERK